MGRQLKVQSVPRFLAWLLVHGVPRRIPSRGMPALAWIRCRYGDAFSADVVDCESSELQDDVDQALMQYLSHDCSAVDSVVYFEVPCSVLTSLQDGGAEYDDGDRAIAGPDTTGETK